MADNIDLKNLEEAVRKGVESANTNRTGDKLSIEDQKSIIEKLLTPIKDILTTVAEQIKTQKNTVTTAFQELEDSVKDNDLLAKFQSRVENMNGSLEEFEKIIDDMKKESSGLNGIIQDAFNLRIEELKKLRDLQKKEIEYKNKEEQHRKTFDKMLRHHENNFDSFFSKLGLKAFNNKSNPDGLFTALDAMRKNKGDPNAKIDLQGYVLSQGKVLKQMIDPLNIALNIMSNMKTQSLSLLSQLDTQTVAFYKATGQIGDYGNAIRNAWGETRIANVTLEDMSRQFISLFGSIRTFTSLSREGQESLAEYGALASRLGADGVGKAFSFFMDSLKQSTNETKASVSSLLGIAKTTGESLKKITDDFLQALPTISVYGKQATSVFRDLFTTAKSLKIETSALLEISKGYDTFDEAATKVGRLNSVLGGPYLNTLQLMNQTEGERVRTLYQAFKATGQTWEQLPKYTRLAIANAAGINDMSTANAVFSGSLADVSKYSRKAALAQSELEERNKRAATLQEKWNNLLSQAGIVLMPVLDALHSVVSLFTEIASSTPGKVFIAMAGSLYILSIALGQIQKPFNMLKRFFSFFKGKEVASTADTIKKIGEETANVAAPVAKTGGILTKFGSVLKGVGKVVGTVFDYIGGAISGIAKGIGSALTSIGSSIASILPAIGAGIAGFATSLAAAAPAIVIASAAIAAGILLIGGAIQLVIGLGKALSSSPLEQLTSLTDSLGKTGPDFAGKMTATGNSLALLSEKFNNVKTANVESFTDLFKTLKKYSDSFSIEGIGFINAYASFMGSIADITPTKIDNVSQITKNIVQMSQDVQDNKSINGLLDKLTTLIGSNNTNNNVSGNKGQMVNVSVYLDKDLLVKAIVPAIENIGLIHK